MKKRWGCLAVVVVTWMVAPFALAQALPPSKPYCRKST
jgi:hypothetical protein